MPCCSLSIGKVEHVLIKVENKGERTLPLCYYIIKNLLKLVNLACASVLDEIENQNFLNENGWDCCNCEEATCSQSEKPEMHTAKRGARHFTPKESRAFLAKIILFSREIHQKSVNMLFD